MDVNDQIEKALREFLAAMQLARATPEPTPPEPAPAEPTPAETLPDGATWAPVGSLWTTNPARARTDDPLRYLEVLSWEDDIARCLVIGGIRKRLSYKLAELTFSWNRLR